MMENNNNNKKSYKRENIEPYNMTQYKIIWYRKNIFL